MVNGSELLRLASSSDDRDFLLHDCNFRCVLMQAL
jgi:hypothetical protein